MSRESIPDRLDRMRLANDSTDISRADEQGVSALVREVAGTLGSQEPFSPCSAALPGSRAPPDTARRSSHRNRAARLCSRSGRSTRGSIASCSAWAKTAGVSIALTWPPVETARSRSAASAADHFDILTVVVRPAKGFSRFVDHRRRFACLATVSA